MCQRRASGSAGGSRRLTGVCFPFRLHPASSFFFHFMRILLGSVHLSRSAPALSAKHFLCVKSYLMALRHMATAISVMATPPHSSHKHPFSSI